MQLSYLATLQASSLVHRCLESTHATNYSSLATTRYNTLNTLTKYTTERMKSLNISQLQRLPLQCTVNLGGRLQVCQPLNSKHSTPPTQTLAIALPLTSLHNHTAQDEKIATLSGQQEKKKKKTMPKRHCALTCG